MQKDGTQTKIKQTNIQNGKTKQTQNNSRKQKDTRMAALASDFRFGGFPQVAFVVEVSLDVLVF